MITDTVETLMGQAPSVVTDYLFQAVKATDAQFGDGYAKEHPDLVVAFIREAALDFHTMVNLKAIEERDRTLAKIERAIVDSRKRHGSATT